MPLTVPVGAWCSSPHDLSRSLQPACPFVMAFVMAASLWTGLHVADVAMQVRAHEGGRAEL